MTDKAPSSASSPSPALPGSERPDYRGKCLYKTGKCLNERALKTSGAAHNLCDEHRSRQNQHQRKLDAKHRLTKRERRGKSPKPERFAPYAKRRSADELEAETLMASVAGAAAVSAQASPTNTGLLGLASASPQPPVMYLPNGPQPPQPAYPFAVQDFDGIVVPLPSYLEGQERVEFRSRIYQKVLDFISEECILRFGAKVEPRVPADSLPPPETSSADPESEPQAVSETSVAMLAVPSESPDTAETEQGAKPTPEEPRTAGSPKKVH